jgi:tRNA (cmo5U34)-methyltransferase
MSRCDGRAWKSHVLVEKYLKWVRKAVPLSSVQIEIMMRIISSREGSVHSFLDLGCGNGILAAPILHRFPKAKGVLLDFSLPMIEVAQRKLRTFSRTLEYVIADYGDPGWIDSVASSVPFDVVVSGFSIHHQQDRRKQSLYNEIYTVLKPG